MTEQLKSIEASSTVKLKFLLTLYSFLYDSDIPTNLNAYTGTQPIRLLKHYRGDPGPPANN